MNGKAKHPNRQHVAAVRELLRIYKRVIRLTDDFADMLGRKGMRPAALRKFKADIKRMDRRFMKVISRPSPNTGNGIQRAAKNAAV